jgi:hypothetical protein
MLLVARRDAIGRRFLPSVNPIVNPTLDSGRLTFRNAAVDAAVGARPKGYLAGAPVSAWEAPIAAYFRSRNGGWSLVGLERPPKGL